jgi:predicted DsbA family dithiol-disulfide isomerase
MRINAIYYLDVISSWCFWSEPAWAELKRRYENRVDFQWKIALMDKSGLPISHEQHQWFYRRSGLMMRSPFMLRCDWCDHDLEEYLAPNCVAQAGKDLGQGGDRVRLALAYAGLREGKKIGEWEVAAEIGAKASGLEKKKLLEHAQSAAIEKWVRSDTAEFHALQVTQRPTFLFVSDIGDRAVFSGFAKLPPLVAALESMLDDIAIYEAHAAHFGEPPSE